MSVHFLALHSPDGSPVRTLVTADGTAHAWPAPSSGAARPLVMQLVDRAQGPGEDEPFVLVDSAGRQWIHPAHRMVTLRDERPGALRLLPPDQARA